MIRIFSGKYKGRKLIYFKNRSIRPITNKNKERIFNKLRKEVEGALVLDLFSGTGNLGFESLSQGAKFVCFVDKNKSALKILYQNIKHLKIPQKDYRVIQSDIFLFFKKESNPFDIIFIDPPFKLKIADSVMKSLCESNLFHEKTVLVIESCRTESLLDEYSCFTLYDRKSDKDKNLSFYKVKNDL